MKIKKTKEEIIKDIENYVREEITNNDKSTNGLEAIELADAFITHSYEDVNWENHFDYEDIENMIESLLKELTI